MSGRLENKVALITGTGGGQGRAAALRFASEGALVVGCDVKVEGNEETARMVQEAGGQMTGMAPIDLGDPDQAKAWVEEAAAVHGRVDVLYNNASACRFGSIEEMSIEDFHFGTRNEVDLVFYVTKYAWPYLKQSHGVVISTASTAGHGGSPNGISHCTNKGAILAMSRVFAVEGAAHGIRAVTISPGAIRTPGTAFLFENPAFEAGVAAHTLMGRVGEADDIASLAAFLASDDASYINNRDFIVDGGGGR